MNTQTLQTALNEMKARALMGELSSSDKLFIKTHFERIVFREFTGTNCKRCYADAFIEMYVTFNKYGLRDMPNFKLKRGVVFRSANFPEVVTNSNLTDELAIKWLKDNPARADLFAIIPDDWNSGKYEQKEVQEEDEKPKTKRTKKPSKDTKKSTEK